MTITDLRIRCEAYEKEGFGHYKVFVDFDHDGENECEADDLVPFNPFWSNVEEGKVKLQ